ncbi:MAG: hypothetical protein HKN84_09095 [Gammaproteobacteria bacterium]|nr:hypothetical protein [Gammaproteobacteria bacterium]
MEFEDSANPDTFTANSDVDVRLRNVFVLDYVAETREGTCAVLANAGLNVSPVESLEAALDALRSHEPDALVISIDTPGLDAHALCEVIHRAHPSRSFSIFVDTRSPAQDGLEWTETIPDLRVIEDPVTAQKLAQGIAKA